MKLKVNSVPGYEPGKIIEVKTDASGTILDRFWRRRLRDSKIDNCVSVITEKAVVKSSETTK